MDRNCNYKFNKQLTDDIQVQVDIKDGDFFLSDGTDISIQSHTRKINFSTSIPNEIESKGQINFIKDKNGYLYVENVEGEIYQLKNKENEPLGDKSYSRLTMIGADKHNGINTTVSKHNNGRYYIHKFDDDWLSLIHI